MLTPFVTFTYAIYTMYIKSLSIYNASNATANLAVSAYLSSGSPKSSHSTLSIKSLSILHFK